MRSLRFAAGLFLLAPLVAEFLLGNLPITALSSLLLLAPLYGGGALLIREVVRRTGRGWPSIFVLALAYGVLEEGLTTMSLFNPNYAGIRLLDNGYLAWLGMAGPWTVFVLGLHTVWSISVPIAVMEVLAGPRGTTPWLGRIGLGVTVALFVFGVASTTALSIATSDFVASAPQLIGTVLTVGALVAVAFSLRAPPRASAVGEAAAKDGSHRSIGEPAAEAAGAPISEPMGTLTARAVRSPNPWLVGCVTLVISSAFKLLDRNASAWLYVAAVLALALGTIAVVRFWSAQPGWGDAQRLALATGALITYAWTAFPEIPVLPASQTTDLIGNALFAAGGLVLVALAALQVRRHVHGLAEPGVVEPLRLAWCRGRPRSSTAHSSG